MNTYAQHLSKVVIMVMLGPVTSHTGPHNPPTTTHWAAAGLELTRGRIVGYLTEIWLTLRVFTVTSRMRKN